jgi:hypothetical protein
MPELGRQPRSYQVTPTGPFTQRKLAEMAAVDENTVSRAVRGLPVGRHKAALIVVALLRAQDSAGMEEFLSCG